MTPARIAGACLLVVIGQIIGIVLHPDLKTAVGAAAVLAVVAAGAHRIEETPC